MSKVLIEESNLQAIADSIRAKNGTQETYLPSEMSTAIDNISGGGGVPDWSQIGYEGVPDSLIDTFNYSKNIYDDWDDTAINISEKFEEDYLLTYMPMVNTNAVTNMNKMFYYCYSLKSIPLLNTSSVTDMGYMFYSCYSLKTIPLLDMSSVNTVECMFSECKNLISIPNINTSNSRNFGSMFSGCNNLENIPILDFSKMKSSTRYWRQIFSGCEKLTNNSLNNILKGLLLTDITTAFARYKTLAYIGLTQSQADICTNFSEWQTLLNNGWTTGYEG